MNFIVIMNDTLRPDYLGCYGNGWVKTPTADAFAKSAAVFDRGYVASYPTIPNRTDLLTGRFGEPLHPWLPLEYGAVTLPRLLAENGYVTQLICDTPHLIQGGGNFDFPFHAWEFLRGQEVDKVIVDHDPPVFPYADYSKVNGGEGNRIARQICRNARHRKSEEDWSGYKVYQSAVDWLERNHKHEKFLLWIDGFDPHPPVWPPQEYTEMYDPGYDGDVFLTRVIAEKLTEAEIFNIKARYAGTVTFVDKLVGRVLKQLEDLGRAEDTCVTWISDHGGHLGEHGRVLGKNCAFEEIARTVTMIRVPGVTSKGLRSDEFIQPPDIAPTLLDLAGIAIPEIMQGVSATPILRGEEMHIRDVAITGKMIRNGRQEMMLGARDGRWVLNDYADAEKCELYDMENDPDQERNLINENPDEAARLHEAVLAFLRNHESPPEIMAAYKNHDPGALKNYKHHRKGLENYQSYFSHLYEG
jgi:arylsulfatase A-like enzyme